MMNNKKLFLLDAMALIYRSYYAFKNNPRFNSKGLNTSAILGFTNTLFDLIQKEKPTHLGVAFDTMAPTARHEEFLEYKANREEMPEELSASIPYIKRIISAFNIPILFVDGYEADDVIGTLAKKAEQNGFQTFMITPDKDFGQLVSENIFILKPPRMGNQWETMGIKEVCEKFGIQNPEQVIDFLGLAGDTADNIPGIPGIGEVTARKLIHEFYSIENIIAQADEIKNEKIREKVKAYSKQAEMCKSLATIILDVPIDFVEEELKINEYNTTELRKIFDELEFKALSKRILGDTPVMPKAVTSGQTDLFAVEATTTETVVNENKQNIHTTPHNYKLANTPELQQELLALLQKQSEFCFDTETTGLDPILSQLVGIAFSWKAQEAWYLPLPLDFNSAQQLLLPFKTVFENPNIKKIGQNLKFDIGMLRNYDIHVNGLNFDTMLAHYLLQPDLRHNMDYLAETYLNYTPVSIEQLIGSKGKNQGNMADVPVETVKEYACEDADITLQLKNVFLPQLKKNEVFDLFNNVEMPLIRVLQDMEHTGVKIDVAPLQDYSLTLQTEITHLEQQVYQLAGVDFNLASPKQLGEVLFDKMKLVEKAKQTKTKQYSTSEETLQKLADAHPIIPLILEYRSLSKLKSTYVDALPQLVNSKTGRIHTSYNQAVAATGRLSSNNPNLQNIPIRTEKGKELRKAFIPSDSEHTLLSADYSQIELRIMAALSNDSGMLEAFHQGQDIHAATASKVYGVPIDEVTGTMRRNAKTVNFGIIYGISAFGLAERLSIPRKEASEIIKQYFEKYPDIKKYMDSTIVFAQQNGFVQTLLGRKRYIRDINSNNSIVRGYAERNAINAPIQGTAADMIKIAMIQIYQAFEQQQLKSKMMMQVHDELVFDVVKSELEQVKEIISEKMTTAVKINVPLEIAMNTGNNWLEAH